MGAPNAELQFRRLFDDHYLAILRYFIRRIGEADAPDATDEVFLVAWRRLDKVPPGSEAVPWLFGVARNVLANHERSTRRRTRLVAKIKAQPVPRGSSPEAVVEGGFGIREIQSALARLSGRDQEVLKLAAWDGLSHAEIGSVLGCSENAVAVRIHRARCQLEKALSGTGHRRVNRAAHAAEGDDPW